MNFNNIARGVILNFVLNVGLVFFLINLNFELTFERFTYTLITLLFIVAFFSGGLSKQYAKIDGFFIGGISSLLLFLYLATEDKVSFTIESWKLNLMIFSLWSLIGYIAAWIGYAIFHFGSKKE